MKNKSVTVSPANEAQVDHLREALKHKQPSDKVELSVGVVMALIKRIDLDHGRRD